MPFKELADKISHDKIEGVSFSGGESLLYLEERVLPIATLIKKKNPNIYQWLYTNGKLVNSGNLKELKKAGIKEVRMNLAATGFNEQITDKIPMAKEIIGKVTVEVPAIPEVYQKLIKENLIHKIIDSGVEQINLAEFYMLHKKAIHYIKNKDVYYSKLGLLSPLESRNITVDIMEYVIKNKLPVLVNDCSNDAKYLQDRKRKYSKDLFKIYT